MLLCHVYLFDFNAGGFCKKFKPMKLDDLSVADIYDVVSVRDFANVACE